MCSFGTYSDSGMNGIVFHQFCYREQNSRNRRNSGLFGIDRIAGKCSFGDFRLLFWRENCVPRFPRSHRLNFYHVSYSVFRIAQSLFFSELIFCMLLFFYRNKNRRHSPKECAYVCCCCKVYTVDPPLWWSFSTALLMSGLTGSFVLSASWYSEEDAAKCNFRTVFIPQRHQKHRAAFQKNSRHWRGLNEKLRTRCLFECSFLRRLDENQLTDSKVKNKK